MTAPTLTPIAYLPMPEEPTSEFTAPAAPMVPHSRETEEAVIGCVLINPNCLYDLSFLKADDFYIHRLRWIFEAFRYMEARRMDIDLLTIADEMERRGSLAEIGGPAFLTSLINHVPTSLNAENYGRIVEEYAIRRKLIEAANRDAQMAYDTNSEIAAVIEQSKTNHAKIEVTNSGRNFMRLDNLLSMVYDDAAERAKNPQDIWGLPTGLDSLDKETGGMQCGELGYLPGQSGIGKTWLMLGWGMEFGKHMPGAIISMEMRKISIGRRLLSGISGVKTRALKSGRFEDGDWDRMNGALGKYDNFPLWIDDGTYSTDSLHSALHWAKREFGCKWFILDYALLLSDSGRDEVEKTNLLAGRLKNIVQDLDMAGLVLHHLTKMGGQSNTPDQGDMRGSQRQTDAADLQLFLTKLDENDNDIVKLGLSPEQKSNMRTLWCTKGRELEQSRVKVHLTRKTPSPFWGELSTKRTAQDFRHA